MKLGILGVGELTEKIVAGVYRVDPSAEIILSPRNTQRAAKLNLSYGCRIADSNQCVVEAADTLLIGVRPDALPQLAASLSIRETQTVVSLVAGVSSAQLRAIFNHQRVVRLMLTYAAEINRTSVVMTDCEADIQHYFSQLGELTLLQDEAAFELATVSMCINGWFYQLAAGLQSWMVKQGMSPDDARRLTLGAMRDCAEYGGYQANQSLEKLLQSIATEGTFTAQGLEILQHQQFLRPWTTAAEEVFRSLNISQHYSEPRTPVDD